MAHAAACCLFAILLLSACKSEIARNDPESTTEDGMERELAAVEPDALGEAGSQAAARETDDAREDVRLARAAAEADGGDALDDPLSCLARAVYFESLAEPEKGQRAVAHVVMNRVEHPDFPDSVCRVVKEGGPEAPCQFSWWCDGKDDIAGNEEEYREVVEIARQVLAGESDDPTDGANMFHATYVNPGWTSAAEGRGQIGDHLFYYLDDR